MPRRYRLAVETALHMEPVYSERVLPQEGPEVVVEKTHHGLQRCHLLQADHAKEQVRNLLYQATDVAVYPAPI